VGLHQTWNVHVAALQVRLDLGPKALPRLFPRRNLVPHLERINPPSQQKIPLGFRISCVKFLVASRSSSEH
jgi:hypothetical protein